MYVENIGCANIGEGFWKMQRAEFVQDLESNPSAQHPQILQGLFTFTVNLLQDSK